MESTYIKQKCYLHPAEEIYIYLHLQQPQSDQNQLQKTIRPSQNFVVRYLFLFLLLVNILLLKSNLTAPGVEVENLKEKV